jgi:glutamate-5-semialdehyde dehydrogenase
MTLEQDIVEVAQRAQRAASQLSTLETDRKDGVLTKMAELLKQHRDDLMQANSLDLHLAREKGLSAAMLDRLTVNDATISSMVSSLNELCLLADPVGSIEEMVKRPNGLLVGRMRVPLGVIAMIYEARPNVTVDAAALCLKTGNAVILRGGSEAFHSNLALAGLFRQALAAEGVVEDSVQLLPVTDRAAVDILLAQDELIDLVIPRGGEGLIRSVTAKSRIPVLKHYKGVCHIYVDQDADLTMVEAIVVNAKTQRPGVCNALEGLLVHRRVAERCLPDLARVLAEKGVELRGCPQSVALSPNIVAANNDDWGREFLDLILCVKVVESYREAKEYIARFGSKHTETIITENYSTAQRFLAEIDASAVMVNASTRFNDGGQLGLGAEIGISTTKLHAYGPMGLAELTTRKFIVYGQGQVRR